MAFQSENDEKIIYQGNISGDGDTGLPTPSDNANISSKAELVGSNKTSGILNPEIEKLVDDYSEALISSKQDYTPIHVDEIASNVARLYEKIRKIVDWKDDNALRRGAVERVLKRILFPKLSNFSKKHFDSEKLAETITLELIRGGHLPNDEVPIEQINVVARALDKYLIFLEYLSTYKSFAIKEKNNFATFVMEIAACEIEEILANPIKENGVILAMTESLNDRISIIPSNSMTPEEKLKQIKVATERTLYDLDDNYIVYKILKQKYPNWGGMDIEAAKEVARELLKTWKDIYMEINIPSAKRFTAVAEKVDTVFMLLDDVLEQIKDRPKEIKSTLENKEEFEKLLTKSYKKRFVTLKTRLLHLAVFSTLSVFLSNWLTFFVVEVPLAHLFYEGFNTVAAIVDFLIPTLVMFLLVIMIKPPKENNLRKVISTTMSFIYQGEGQEHYQVRTQKRRFNFFYAVMTILYTLTSVATFYGIGYVFYISKLPITSVIFDTLTIALTVYAAVVIRNQSKELNVDEGRTPRDFILDIITVPIAKVGSILAKKWKEYNVVAFFFNFIIEAPLATILDFIQGWSEFIKERRSELH